MTVRHVPSRLHFLPFLAAVFVAVGCATSSVGIVTSNIPLEGRQFTVLGTAETERSWYSFDMGFIGIPLRDPPVDEAIADLLKAKGGDALINLRYFTDRTIILFVTRHRFHLKAEVVKLNSPALP